MRTLVLIYFWLMVVITLMRVFEMALSTWPQQRKPKSLGLAAGETIIGALFLIWAGIVLWQ